MFIFNMILYSLFLIDFIFIKSLVFLFEISIKLYIQYLYISTYVVLSKYLLTLIIINIIK